MCKKAKENIWTEIAHANLFTSKINPGTGRDADFCAYLDSPRQIVDEDQLKLTSRLPVFGS
jgi:hypothetical protein